MKCFLHRFRKQCSPLKGGALFPESVRMKSFIVLEVSKAGALKFLNHYERRSTCTLNASGGVVKSQCCFRVPLSLSPCGVTNRERPNTSASHSEFAESMSFTLYIFRSGRFRSKKLRERQHFSGAGAVNRSCIMTPQTDSSGKEVIMD